MTTKITKISRPFKCVDCGERFSKTLLYGVWTEINGKHWGAPRG